MISAGGLGRQGAEGQLKYCRGRRVASLSGLLAKSIADSR
jgi:hypothetical protein